MSDVLTAFSVGLLAANSPCVLPLYPGFLAYLSGMSGSGRRPQAVLGLLVLGGVLTMMLLLGAGTAAFGLSINRTLGLLIPAADGVLVAMGLLLLLNRNPFSMVPQMQMPVLSHPFVNAFCYGLLYGPLILPCSAPLIISIFALSASIGEALPRLNLFLWFGLGFGLPLLLLSLLSGLAQRRITTWLVIHARALSIIGGLLLLVAGVYDLKSNWVLIRLAWGR